jgi:hypothetical protein
VPDFSFYSFSFSFSFSFSSTLLLFLPNSPQSLSTIIPFYLSLSLNFLPSSCLHLPPPICSFTRPQLQPYFSSLLSSALFTSSHLISCLRYSSHLISPLFSFHFISSHLISFYLFYFLSPLIFSSLFLSPVQYGSAVLTINEIRTGISSIMALLDANRKTLSALPM